MAWNEPGGNSNNQDPWGGRRGGGDKKGPPDLDEAFRKLQDSLNGMFGSGKKRGGDSGSGKGAGFGLLGIGLAILLTPGFAALHLPALTAPFILACWLVRAGQRMLHKPHMDSPYESP